MTTRCLLVVNSKGGCGKTTIANNLAGYFARQGQDVALLDLDPQRASLRWLDRRPKDCPAIHGFSGWGWKLYPDEVEWVIMDAPGQIERKDLAQLVARADGVIIPVLPSPIDISAAADFIGTLLLCARIRSTDKCVGIVANRVRANTLIYRQLRKFLESLRIPFISTLRDSQNYIRASQEGLGIFEMPRTKVSSDLRQWAPIVRWIENDAGASWWQRAPQVDRSRVVVGTG
ncbi:MAG: ParA family protein [Gammaproteobacteria bacterium]|nr:ParA family protein [Gammaproteobacteria bacterium]